MTRNGSLFLVLTPALLSAGCNDLGECKGGDMAARKPVVVGTQVMYAGQAVLVQTCASQFCHVDGATGVTRLGAPGGLDFSIQPAVATAETMTNEQGQAAAVIDPADLERLRSNQRKVFEERESIWEQVSRELMPPEGNGAEFRAKQIGTLVTVQGSSCTRGDELGSIQSGRAREELRNWLACGAPVVETNTSAVLQPAAGTVGDQYPALQCGGAIDSFDALHEAVFAPTCVTNCHQPGFQMPDLSTADAAYASLLGPDGMGAPQGCDSNPVPYVTPSEPDSSYLLAKLGAGGEFCGSRMPPIGDALPADQIELIRTWIAAGAPRGSFGEGGGSDAGAGGGDAGVSGDAGQ